jgi:hypothetical protein
MIKMIKPRALRSGAELPRSRFSVAGRASRGSRADLMEVLRDLSIRGIITPIGGDSKVFLGYSDTTVSHFAFLKAGVTSFYGPSLFRVGNGFRGRPRTLDRRVSGGHRLASRRPDFP